MKKVSIFLFFCILFSSVVFSQSGAGKADASFVAVEHDFGALKEQVGKATCEFEFTNIGTVPLIINRVNASCGCTTPAYTREPVLPGKKGKINVTYSTVRRPGNFNKRITVYTNAPDTTYVLRIKGTVTPKK